MSLIVRMCRQRMTYWKRSDRPDSHGRFTFAPPEEIDARWTLDTEQAVNRKDSASAISDTPKQTEIGTAYALIDMRVGDYLYLGPLSEVMAATSTPNDPLTVKKATEVKRFQKMPNFKATEYLRTIYL